MDIKKLIIIPIAITLLNCSLFANAHSSHKAEMHSQQHVNTLSSKDDAHIIGLQLYSLRKQMENNVEQALARVRSWGITDVEGGGALYGHNISEFRQMLDSHNIDIVSVDTSLEEIRDNPIGAAYKAKYYGAHYATIYWIPHDSAAGFGIDDAKKAVDIFNKGGAVLAEHGITLQYHPHGYEFLPYQNGTILDYIIQNTTNAEFQMDVFWIKQGGADPVKILQKYPGRFKSLHLKDRLSGNPISSNGGTDVEKTNVILGTGDVGIASVIEEAKKQGIKYFFIEDESSRVLQQVPQSIKYVKPLIAQ